MNLDRWGGWGAHWVICEDHQHSMRMGGRGKGGHAFATNAMRYVEAITHSDPHAEALANMQPQQLADGWDRIAFLEAIKCAPQRPRSEPYPEMFEVCPPTYLADELEILRPKTVLVLGRSRLRDAVRPLLRNRFNLEWGTHPPGLEADQAMIAGESVTILCVNHPSARPAAVSLSLRSLIDLRQRLASAFVAPMSRD